MELNSPINIGSGTTIFLFALALFALGFWAYLRDKRNEKRRVAREAKEKEDQDEKRLRKAKIQRDIERLENEKVIEVPRSQMTQQQTEDIHHDSMDRMIPLLAMLSQYQRAAPPPPNQGVSRCHIFNALRYLRFFLKGVFSVFFLKRRLT